MCTLEYCLCSELVWSGLVAIPVLIGFLGDWLATVAGMRPLLNDFVVACKN